MKIISVYNTQEVAESLAQCIKGPLLDGKRTLWLISGGSSIPVAYEVSKLLNGIDCSKLYVSLVDEKIIEDKNAPGNMQQLLDTGFTIEAAHVLPVLRESATLRESADQYESNLLEQVASADFTIGQFGLGDGFHTGGILAHSPAITDDSYVKYYASDDAEHITITTKVISLLDVAFINSMGSSKKPLVDHFLISREQVQDEPTQALKTAGLTVLCTDTQ